MITAQEAYDAIDPATPEPQRKEYAERLIASSAAYDSYLDSRPQLEQIIAQASGAGKVPSHDELNNSPDSAQVAAGDGTVGGTPVQGDSPAIGSPLAPADQVGAPPDAQVVGDSTAAPSGAALTAGSAKADFEKDDDELQAEIDAMNERVKTLEAQKKGEA